MKSKIFRENFFFLDNFLKSLIVFRKKFFWIYDLR